MSLNDLLMRARSYIYDREGFEPFVDDLLDAAQDDREAVATYLMGHGLAIARWTGGRGKDGPWFWLDKRYLPAIAATMRNQKRALQLVGVGHFQNPDELDGLEM